VLTKASTNAIGASEKEACEKHKRSKLTEFPDISGNFQG
jgi:hypothetical protein